MKGELILPSPDKPTHLHDEIQWLSGEGCGSWFLIEALENHNLFLISRFSPEGKLECKGEFKQTNGLLIDLNSSYHFTYLSHCAEVNIIQNNNQLKFNLVNKIK